jgi:hypothetical protein
VTAVPRPDAARGVRIGRYLVTGRIGRGGMGMVYRALDEALEREVALKTLNQEGSLDADSRRRFEVEAKAAARLHHPNIVVVYELGEDRGVPYIAMEMLPGADLEAVLRGGEPLSLGEKLDVMAQVCRGLAYAHEHGIVHRDVKPSNIRLLDDGAVKIMDFGIAKLGGMHLTKTGMMVGTVHYMSPEQVRGRGLDGRSDVFSAGVILYELLAGQRPFRADAATQVLYKIVNEQPPPLDVAALGQVGTRLSATVARALAKDRDERYPTAAAMADELCSLLADVRRAAAPPSAESLQALDDARRLLREGDGEQALALLRALCEAHPEFTEARRALRAALKDRQRPSEGPQPSADGYPELEATFKPTATRLEPGTELAPTVLREPAPGSAPPRSTVTLLAAKRRAWLWSTLGLLTVAALAASMLLRGGRPAPSATLHLPVHSLPVGASVLVDGRDSGVVTNGELLLASPAPAQVVLTFRKAGHRDETRAVRLPLAAGQAVSVTLQASVSSLTLRSEPAGASVTLDGERVAGTTPLELALDPAREHRLGVALDGYVAQEVRIAKGERPGGLQLSLQKVAPPGTVELRSSYPLDVLWHGKPLARGVLSPRLSVPGGHQTLTLVAPAVFLHSELGVTVPSDGEVSLDAPALGKLNVRASPDNCEVFVDGAFVDYPPILDRAAVVGRHTVGFRWPDGRRNEQSAEVTRGAPAFVFGRKE